MRSVALDETIRLIACNVGLLVHIFYLSLMAQRVIDYSDKFQEVMYAYKINIEMLKNEEIALI